MRLITLSSRTAKEILRDPLNLCFGLGFPVILILLLTAIQRSIPVPMFELEHLTPGITVFGLSFITLFSATLISKDRESALLQRLYTTPLTVLDFILGYSIPLLPMAVAQCIISYAVSIILGLKIQLTLIYAVLFIIPISFFYIALGLLFGSILNVKQVGGICGALLTNVSAWLSGIWFDVELMGNGFKTFANTLPFIHAVELERTVLSGAFGEALPHLTVVLVYAMIAVFGAVALFLRQMKKQ